MRQDVTGYQLEIKGWERTEHPQKFDRIIVEHVLTGHNLNQAMVNKAIPARKPDQVEEAIDNFVKVADKVGKTGQKKANDVICWFERLYTQMNAMTEATPDRQAAALAA